MRLIKFLLVAVSLFALTACLGGGSTKSSVDDDTRIIVTTTVGSDGKVAYTGSGEMAGFALSGTAAGLAGKTVYIEKSDAEYSVDGYVSLSPVYTVSVADKADAVYALTVTLPYSSTILANEGGSAADTAVCILSGSSVTKLTSGHGSGSDVTAVGSVPASFFVGLKKEQSESSLTGIIKFEAVSYRAAAAASSFLVDPSAKSLPDSVRGIDRVQPGEKVRLFIDTVTFGDTVTSFNWTLTSKPAGSLAAITLDGTNATFIPDVAGKYTVSLSLVGVNSTKTESVTLYALNYSYNTATNSASCVVCHDGTFAGSGITDKYGRNVLRAITTPWAASAHGNSFAAVAASTDSRCFQCHATGFLFADRNGNGSDEFSDAKGYDDKITNWSTMASTGGDHLKSVSCEACHGPNDGSSANFFEKHYKNTAITSNVCLSCHDYGTVSGHVFGYSDGHDNAHKLSGGNVAKNAACFKCHTGEGMMGRIFSKNITPANTDRISGIGCSVCHDPHGESGQNSQLRISGSYTLPTKSTVVAAGDSKLCYYCHNADGELPTVGAIPHNSQAELISGVGGYEYGQNLGTTASSHSATGCSTCHMKTQGGTTHSLDMTDDTAARIAGCTTGCHTTNAPAYSNGTYDVTAGTVAAAKAKIAELKTAINAKAGEVAGTAIKASYTGTTTAQTNALNRAAYNYNFILNDRSGGFHNPGYVVKLVNLSLADLAAN
ncbi:cytochrome c3 family protein [Seleniivibrio woodruffii]|uniref:cytochrome c3 family protein n=1 Tax=Seleniivibrio woodruffii TaxID=1078050 RepID=UPI00240A5CA3|nr:cytochrome c3 family protein [Seleniivibrio woodruffii]